MITQAVWPGLTATPDCIKKARPDSAFCLHIPSHSESELWSSEGTKRVPEKPPSFLMKQVQAAFSGIWTASCMECCTLWLCTSVHICHVFNGNKLGMGTIFWMFTSSPTLAALLWVTSGCSSLQLSHPDLLEVAPELEAVVQSQHLNLFASPARPSRCPCSYLH